jgi:hypothetical protein
MSGNNNVIDLTGFRHPDGRLTALRYKRCGKHGAIWEFRCDCGTVIEMPGWPVKSGKTKSCGCLRMELLQAKSKHFEAFGESKTFSRWLKDPRCLPWEHALRSRLVGGWNFEQAISTPVRPKRKALDRKVPLRELLRMSV